MTNTKTTNRNRRTFNPATDKVRLNLVHVKILGRGKCEGMDTDMGPALVLNTQLAVQNAIKAWRNEYNVPVNHDHRPLTKILVREVKGDHAIGTGVMTQAEEDRQEEILAEKADKAWKDYLRSAIEEEIDELIGS